MIDFRFRTTSLVDRITLVKDLEEAITDGKLKNLYGLDEIESWGSSQMSLMEWQDKKGGGNKPAWAPKGKSNLGNNKYLVDILLYMIVLIHPIANFIN